MKCKSCGAEIAEDTVICENCGFNVAEHKRLERVVVYDDPEVDKSERAGLVDNPVLAFIFSILANIFGVLFVVSPVIIILYALLFVGFNVLTFVFANKKARIKFKPIADIAKVLAYLSIAFVLLKFVFELSKLIIK